MVDNLEAVVARVVVGSVVVAVEYDGHNDQSSWQHQVGVFRCQVLQETASLTGQLEAGWRTCDDR